ncbi:transposase, partial [Nitrosomonas sp. Nm132]|uniref:transposase n=1 Tax=Nitrosomonas sp. Nm132 TaxID=1881053 RepID=UPI0008880464
VEDQIRLAGWSRARRIGVLRRQVKDNLATKVSSDAQQGTLHFVDHSDKIKVWEHVVLVTNADYSLEALGQLYRDRADCENGFDELKNQWGWGGYTTHDLERCNLSARAVALIYNWWSWYVRLARHAGQSRLLLTLAHEAGDQIKAMIANVRKGLDSILANAPQLPKIERWPTVFSNTEMNLKEIGKFEYSNLILFWSG